LSGLPGAAGPAAAPASRICLPLTGSSLQENAALLRRERQWLDLVELRADFLAPAELAHLARFPALVDLPVILSQRRVKDGGRWRGEEADRLRLLREALRPAAGGPAGGPGYAFLDLEHDLHDSELEGAARARGCRVIRSFYDPRCVPTGLAARVRRLARRAGERGELAKAEVRVRGSRDQRRLAEAFRELQGVEKILLGVGEFGGFSRILAGKLNSWLTYCSPARAEGEGEGAAEGQTDPRVLTKLYRFRRIGPDTSVYGVVGNPVAHSRSPHLHNAGFAALGLDAVYLPFLADELPEFLRAAEALEVRGLSVTVPFKEQALRLARRGGAEPGGESSLLSAAGEVARAVGAANTLIAAQERWQAANTDVAGFLAPLQRQAPALLEPGGTAVVLGAGGAARAVVHALTRHGLKVLVLNRTPARARALARRFGCAWGGLEAREAARLPGGPALIVQTTSVGLKGAGDPLPEYRFEGQEVVYELVYGREPTAFLQRARSAGCRTISGEQMLRAQAAAQFRLFTGSGYPEGL
jgi:3-dehydroquinate dehydratase/shikimate dehydrogenase